MVIRHIIGRCSPSKRRGVALVEFAFVAPIVFILFFACIELTWLNMVRNSVSNAAYEAARRAVIPNTTEASVKAAALSTLQPLGMDNGTTFEIIEDDGAIEVTITVPLSENSWGITRLTHGMELSKTIKLSRE